MLWKIKLDGWKGSDILLHDLGILEVNPAFVFAGLGDGGEGWIFGSESVEIDIAIVVGAFHVEVDRDECCQL